MLKLGKKIVIGSLIVVNGYAVDNLSIGITNINMFGKMYNNTTTNYISDNSKINPSKHIGSLGIKSRNNLQLILKYTNISNIFIPNLKISLTSNILKGKSDYIAGKTKIGKNYIPVGITNTTTNIDMFNLDITDYWKLNKFLDLGFGFNNWIGKTKITGFYKDKKYSLNQKWLVSIPYLYTNMHLKLNSFFEISNILKYSKIKVPNQYTSKKYSIDYFIINPNINFHLNKKVSINIGYKYKKMIGIIGDMTNNVIFHNYYISFENKY